MILALAAVQAVVSVPVTAAPPLPPITTGYAIVVARAVKQADPIRIACGAEHCTSWFLGSFDQVRNIAGTALPPKFQARIEMGSPFNERYTLALLVEDLADGSHRVRAAQGFHYQTKLACFDIVDTRSLNPEPTGAQLVRNDRALCVK